MLYLAEKRAPRRFPRPASGDLFGDVARNFQVFDPLDFIAELTQHIPDPRRHLVRYFGFYSNKARGRRAKAIGEQPRRDRPQPYTAPPRPPTLGRAHQAGLAG